MSGCQRWRARRDSYRRPDEQINPLAYEVAAIAGDTVPKAFVCEHHYSASYPNARYRFGLYTGGALVGVAVFSHPANDAVLTGVFPGDPLDSVELGRFVLLDRVPGNGESWFLARCLAQLRGEGLRGVVSFSDPVPRTDAGGRVTFAGHLGIIYQASNARYLGRATPRTLHLFADGSVFSAKAEQKIRDRDKGWRYASELLVRAGAAPLQDDEDARAWLRRWVPLCTRRLRHPGNHRYAFPLHKRAAMVGAAVPYPKHGGLF